MSPQVSSNQEKCSTQHFMETVKKLLSIDGSELLLTHNRLLMNCNEMLPGRIPPLPGKPPTSSPAHSRQPALIHSPAQS
jgi:hypothetical protein